ncbi:MAG: cobyric acid synthase [Candidatus Omnitrophica bacterium]|nr:cobyric acid synthase [Candidatus Omnitrophota bacterium]
MVQGTGSYVGKSLIVSALCRIFKQDGFRVAPFKAQNMALNSFVTREGGEMGRAQVAQAEAAGIEPSVDMNPILLKPSGDVKAQVVVKGKPVGNMSGREYYRCRPRLLKVIKESFGRLRANYDIIVIEGAGSPAEVNLRKNDLVNMQMAKIADCPVILAGDINVGGVFAWLVGTLELLTAAERKRIKGVIINKFRGDIRILNPGLEFLEKKIKRPVLGVIPYFQDIRIPEEDSIAKERYCLFDQRPRKGKINIEVLYLPHVSNFTDFDPLEKEPDVHLRYIVRGAKVGEPDCIIIPGSKNTIDDLSYLKNSGLAEAVIDRSRRGAVVVGICGGYQMLGREIRDPHNLESRRKAISGLGLLPLVTTILRKKMTHQIQAQDLLFGTGKVSGYEIHMGRTNLCASLRPAFRIRARSKQTVKIEDGVASKDNRVWGTYIHGLFDNDHFRRAFLDSLRKKMSSGRKYPGIRKNHNTFLEEKDKEYDKLAALARKSLDMKKIYSLLEEGSK